MTAHVGMSRPTVDNAISGLDLANEIEAMLRQRPDVSRTNFGFLINGGGSAVDKLRRVLQPKPKTIERVRGLIANPPPESLLQVRPPKAKAPRKSRAVLNPRLVRDRMVATCRRNVHARAAKRIEKGLLAGNAQNSVVRNAQLVIEAHYREVERLNDPIEQAMTVLRRKSIVIYRASVLGGSEDMFVISKRSGRELIDAPELMKLAGSVA